MAEKAPKQGFVRRHLKQFAMAEGLALFAGGGVAAHAALESNPAQVQIHSLDKAQTAGENAAWKLAYGTKGVRRIGEHSVPTGVVEPDPNAAIDDLRVEIEKIIESHANDSDTKVQGVISSVQDNKIRPGYTYVRERDDIAGTLDSMEQSKIPLRVRAGAKASQKARGIVHGIEAALVLPVLMGVSLGVQAGVNRLRGGESSRGEGNQAPPAPGESSTVLVSRVLSRDEGQELRRRR